jgi:enoyl-CoA hydratase/carnithine racemase
MPRVLYERDGRIARITLNRPEVMNAIDNELPAELEAAVERANTEMLATIFDGITRHSPEGLAFKHRAEAVSWKRAVKERDLGTYDWTADKPINRAE